MEPAQGDEEMLPSMRRLFSVGLLLAASGALADSPLPAADASAKEVVTRAPETQKVDEQVRTLTREVESLQSDVQQLRAKEAERAVHEAELTGPNDHPMWP
jgi:hypothetical protein